MTPAAVELAIEVRKEIQARHDEADRLRRRGETAKALRSLTEILGDDPADARARLLRARVRADESDWEAARKDCTKGLADAASSKDSQTRAWESNGVRQLAWQNYPEGVPSDTPGLRGPAKLPWNALGSITNPERDC